MPMSSWSLKAIHSSRSLPRGVIEVPQARRVQKDENIERLLAVEHSSNQRRLLYTLTCLKGWDVTNPTRSFHCAATRTLVEQTIGRGLVCPMEGEQGSLLSIASPSSPTIASRTSSTKLRELHLHHSQYPRTYRRRKKLLSHPISRRYWKCFG